MFHSRASCVVRALLGWMVLCGLAVMVAQAALDRILYSLAGLSETDWRGLEERLARML